MRILVLLLLLPLTLIFIVFAIANRHIVELSFDPSPLTVDAPLYLLIFLGVFFGLVSGGIIAWLRGGQNRRKLRKAQRKVVLLEGELLAAKTNDSSLATNPKGVQNKGL